jgi:negative regulator of flagellin synthesis FlgM
MEIRNTSESLKALLGVASTSSSLAQQVRSTATKSALEADQTTLSGAGTEASLSAAEDGLRLDKVAEVQAALAAGTYKVPAETVANRLIDAMLIIGTVK